MEIVFEKFSTIVGFLILCIVIQTMLGSEILNQFLLLVLVSMILLNADSFINMVGGM